MPGIKNHTIHSSSYRRYIKAAPVYWGLFKANCNARFGTRAYKVSYQYIILDATFCNIFIKFSYDYLVRHFISMYE